MTDTRRKGDNAADALGLAMLDAFPMPLMVLDDDARIVQLNASAQKLAEQDLAIAMDRRCGAVLRCTHALGVAEGCGRSEVCSECVLRNCVIDVYREGGVVRRPARLELSTRDGVRVINILVTASPLVFDGRTLVLMMLEDIPELISTSGLLPVCAHCHKVRTRSGAWQHADRFLRESLSLSVTHGMCAQCRDELYPELRDMTDADGDR